MEQAYRLLPGRGLDLQYLDDRALAGPPLPLRGAANIRLVDGEWWTREGDLAQRRDIISNAWTHAFSLDVQYSNATHRRHFLISQWGVVEVTLSDGTWSLSVPYTAAWTGTINYTQGSTSAMITTTTGDATLSQLFTGKDSDTVQTLYRKVSLVGATLTLDRPYAGATVAALASSAYATFGNPADVRRRNIAKCSWAVFRQQVTRTVGTVWNDGATTAPWYTEQSPAVAKGGIYLIVCPGVTRSGVPTGPFLIRLDSTETIKGEIMRQTKTSTSAAVAFNAASLPEHCTSWQGRLFVGREDENNANGDRTIWWSENGDLLQWHTGNVGYDASHNLIRLTEGHDKISTMAPLGANLIIHRERSQHIFEPTDSEVTPFQERRNAQGMGCISPRSLVNVRGLHYFWTDYGPATFDGEQVRPLSHAIARMAGSFRSTSEWVTDASTNAWPEAVVGAYHATRQELWWTLFGVGDYWEKAYADGSYASQNLVLDLQNGEAWRLTYMTGFSLGSFRDDATGREIMVRSWPGGTLSQATQTERSKDSALSADGTADDPFAYLETPWLDFGTAGQKLLRRLQIELRTFHGDAAYAEDKITDIVIGSSGTFKYQLDVHTDHDVYTMPVSQRIEVNQADLANIGNLSEGARMTPAMMVKTLIFDRLQGEVFKLRIRNYGDDVPNSRPFRVSQITAFYEDLGDTRRERLT